MNRLDLKKANGGRAVIIGTAHVGRNSATALEQVIEDERPDNVAIELDSARAAQALPDMFEAPADDTYGTYLMPSFQVFYTMFVASVMQAIGRAVCGQPAGTADMGAAARAAQRIGATTVLIDRPQAITSGRITTHAVGDLLTTEMSLSEWLTALGALVTHNHAVVARVVERMGRRERAAAEGRVSAEDAAQLERAYALVAKAIEGKQLSRDELLELEASVSSVVRTELQLYPKGRGLAADKAFAAERDYHLAHRIRSLPGDVSVAAVGAAHVAGIEEVWDTTEADEYAKLQTTDIFPFVMYDIRAQITAYAVTTLGGYQVLSKAGSPRLGMGLVLAGFGAAAGVFGVSLGFAQVGSRIIHTLRSSRSAAGLPTDKD